MNDKKIWFITGVSGGLGLALAKEVLKTGNVAIGTLRKKEQAEEFEALSDNAYAVQMDVNYPDQIKNGIADIYKKFNRIDVLVNNAGYGLMGAIEEISEEEARAQMETNFFGALAITQAVLPIMRKQKSGNILQISSQAGIRAEMGLGLYNASKFAMEGFSEALAKEMKPLNVHVTLIEPGPFRTDWAGNSMRFADREIEDYTATAGMVKQRIMNINGQQPGDPVRAAKAMIELVKSSQPPVHFPIGKSAINAARLKAEEWTKEINAWEHLSLPTDFEA